MRRQDRTAANRSATSLRPSRTMMSSRTMMIASTNGRTYTFRVRAVNDRENEPGNITRRSGRSTETEAGPTKPPLGPRTGPERPASLHHLRDHQRQVMGQRRRGFPASRDGRSKS